MATWFIDPENGNDANSGASFALAWKTISLGATAARVASGDTVRIKASPNPTLVGSATWTNYSDTITLGAAVTLNLDTCDAAWTASANVTITTPTSVSHKEGTGAMQASAASGFTGPGIIAYRTLPSTIDASAYQQISFWLLINIGVVAAGALQLRLCSDAVGAVPVATINLPATGAGNNWYPVTVDTLANLPSNINSISLYCVTKPAATFTVVLDNIFASKASSAADSLTLQSLISKNNGSQGTYAAGEAWWAPRSINGTVIKLDQANQPIGTAVKGYVGTSEVANLYKRECFAMPNTTTNSNAYTNNRVMKGGTWPARVTYSGGWNRTDMSTQTGDTYYHAYGTGGIQFANNTGVSQLAFERLHTVAAAVGFFDGSVGNASSTVSNCSSVNNNGSFIGANAGFQCAVTNCFAVQCASSVLVGSWYTSSITNMYIYCGSSNGVTGLRSGVIKNLVVKGVQGVGIQPSTSKVFLYDCTFDGNTVCDVDGLTNGMETFLSGCSLTSTTDVNTSIATSSANGGLGFAVYSQNHNGVAGAHRTYSDYFVIQTDASFRYGSSGKSWKLSPLSATFRSALYPGQMSLAKILCAANQPVTVAVRVYRDNTGLTASLVCKGSQIPGVPNDVVATASGAANAWEQLSVNFTPTADGVVELVTQVYGGATFNCWVDDLSVS